MWCVRVHLDWLYDAHEKSPTGDISCVDGVEATTGIEPVYAVLQIDRDVLRMAHLSTNPTARVREHPLIFGN